MPNKHDVKKNFISFSFEIELLRKLTKKAESLGITRTDYCLMILKDSVKDVKLTKEEKDQIDNEIKVKRANRGKVGRPRKTKAE